MQHFKRRFMCVALACISVFLIFTLTACDSDDLDFDDSGSGYESEPEYSDGSEDSGDSQSSLLDEPMTAERAEKIYLAFANNSYEDYVDLSQEAWEAKNAGERTEMYEKFSAIAKEIGLKVSKSESEWLESMDWNIDMYNLFLCSLVSLDVDNADQIQYLQSLYSYKKGLLNEKYEALDEKILAAADNLRVEYNLGTYLLCVGGDHNIEQMTYEWTTEEESFAASGSVTAVKTDDIFTNVKVSYSINGQKGIFKTVQFASTDLRPVFEGIGAIDANGAFLTEQIDICAVNVFDAEILYILSKEELGIVTIAVVEFDESQNEYVWDGQSFTARDRCCFNKDNEFCYIDLDGNLQNLTRAYAGGE